ncbi:hypothetical protein O3G_MSEX014709 [Manduca sexta]|uniref:Uncharacterized protein n=2 Tax=Manduca sexta TaxID=7130 RepID=A0A922D253_MANSE|nr:hypothetical protein O3G_MSEX014709 [Manduca sexta]
MISSNDATRITKSSDGKAASMTITKEIDDKYSKGTIKISPGSVSVTSVAKSGAGAAPGAGAFKYQQPTPFIPFRPFIQDPFFFPPIQMPQPRYDPWFPSDKFKNTAQSRTSNVRPSWYYPAFNPYFNYWH